VHYSLKFVAFFLPGADDVPTREELLEGREGANILGVVEPTREELLEGREGASVAMGGVLGFSMMKPMLLGVSRMQGRRGMLHDGVGSIFGRKPVRSASGLHQGISLPSLSQSLSIEQDTATNAIDDETFTKETVTTTSKQQTPTQYKRPRLPILSYTDNYVIVSKPSGMTMHHNSNTKWGRPKGHIFQTTLKKQLSRKPYLVHRLDHRTSGAVMVGFDSDTAGVLHGLLKREDSVKLYVALVRGDLRELFQRAAGEAGEGGSAVDLSYNCDGSIIGSSGKVPPIRIDGARGQFRISSEHSAKITVNLPIKVDDVQKDAETDFYFLSSVDATEEEENSHDDGPRVTKSLTLLLCHPRTGRTHQLRKHVRKAFRAPIIGDSEHGDSRVNRYWRNEVGFDRLGLHCWHLGLPSVDEEEEEVGDGDMEGGAENGGRIDCMAPLTPDFAMALQHEKLAPLWKEATRLEPRLLMEPYDDRGGTFGRHYQKRRHEG